METTKLANYEIKNTKNQKFLNLFNHSRVSFDINYTFLTCEQIRLMRRFRLIRDKGYKRHKHV